MLSMLSRQSSTVILAISFPFAAADGVSPSRLSASDALERDTPSAACVVHFVGGARMPLPLGNEHPL
jgi:hypothetical protein